MITVQSWQLFPLLLTGHMIADFILQNRWMAEYKMSLRHFAAWMHGSIHLIAMLLILPLWPALIIAISHILIDTRMPLTWWRRQVSQTEDNLGFNMWQDQAAHIIILTLVMVLN